MGTLTEIYVELISQVHFKVDEPVLQQSPVILNFRYLENPVISNIICLTRRGLVSVYHYTVDILRPM